MHPPALSCTSQTLSGGHNKLDSSSARACSAHARRVVRLRLARWLAPIRASRVLQASSPRERWSKWGLAVLSTSGSEVTDGFVSLSAPSVPTNSSAAGGLLVCMFRRLNRPPWFFPAPASEWEILYPLRRQASSPFTHPADFPTAFRYLPLVRALRLGSSYVFSSCTPRTLAMLYRRSRAKSEDP